MQTEISKAEFGAKALEILRTIEETGQPVLMTEEGVQQLKSVAIKRNHSQNFIHPRIDLWEVFFSTIARMNPLIFEMKDMHVWICR
jgi:hypothetical protein